MDELRNSIIVEQLVQTLITVIGKKTAPSFAAVTIQGVVDGLKSKYDFLNYIEFEDVAYTEKEDIVSVNLEMDNIQMDKLGRAVDELFDAMIKSLDENIGFYFIKEIQDDLEEEIGPILSKFGVNLDIKQERYLQDNLILGNKIKNSEILEITLNSLLDALQKLSNEYPDSMQLISDSVESLKNNNKYNILNYVKITKQSDSGTDFDMYIAPNVDDVLSATRGETVQKLIKEVGKRSGFRTRRSLIKTLEISLGRKDLIKIKKIGVNFKNITSELKREGHEILTRRTLEVLIELVSERVSTEAAVKIMEKIIGNLKTKDGALNYIKVDNSKYSSGIDAIVIMPEINSINSREVGKSLQALISKTQEVVKKQTYHSILDDFKAKMGEEYLLELDNVGLNMHMIELKAY